MPTKLPVIFQFGQAGSWYAVGAARGQGMLSSIPKSKDILFFTGSKDDVAENVFRVIAKVIFL